MGKRIISMILSVAMVFSAARLTAFADDTVTDETAATTETTITEETAAENADDGIMLAGTNEEVADEATYVARIGDVYYTTLDAAVSASKDGETVVVLCDCTSGGLSGGFDNDPDAETYGIGNLGGSIFGQTKTLTIKGEAGVNPTVTFSKYGVRNTMGNLTFADMKIVMTAQEGLRPSSEGGHGSTVPYAIFTNSDCTTTFNNCTVTMTGANKNDTVGMYINPPGVLNIINSTVSMDGYNNTIWVCADDENYVSPNATINITKSLLTITGSAYTGITSSYTDMTFDNSTVTLDGLTTNNRGISAYYGTNPTITVKNDSVLSVSNGTFRVNDSRAAIYAKNLTVDGTSTVVTYGNTGTGIGITGTAVFRAGSAVSSCDNSNCGIRILSGAKLTAENGADIEITGNKNSGIYSDGTVILPDGAGIHNNSNSSAGDDILSTGTLTIGTAVSGQTLLSCRHDITGWFDDGEEALDAALRWDADTTAKHVVEVTAGTYTGIKALKAAHARGGTLTVEKHVASGDKARGFAFEIRLGDTSYNKDGFKNGIYILVLKDGESKSFSLPAGTTYSIREVADGYTNRSENASGTIVMGETVTASFTNYKTEDVPEDSPSTGTEGSPDTGDTTVDFAFISMLSLAAVAIVTVKRKSEN